MAAQVQTGTGNVTTGFANTGTSAGAVSKPANTADGDVLVACAYGRSNTAQYTGIPAGWVTVDPDGARETATGWQTLFYKVITSAAGEPASYQWSGGANGRHLVIIVRVTGADTTTPFDDAGDDALAVGGTPQTLPMPAVTPAGSDSLLITCESTQTGTGAAASILNPPAGLTKITTVSTTSGSQNNHLGMSFQQLAAAGSTGVLTFTASSTLQSGVGYGLTIRSGVTATNVNLTGQPVGSTTAAPSGAVSATSSSSVNLTGQVVGSVTAAAAGGLEVVTSITDSGQTATSTTAAPAGSVVAASSISLTGASVGSLTTAPSGTVATTSSVNLTGQAAGSVTASPAGTVAAGSAAGNVTLTGQSAGSVTSAAAGALAIVSNTSMTGQVVGSTTGAPAGVAGSESVQNVNLTGQATGPTTASPAGALTLTSNVALTGEVAASALNALAGSMALASLVQITGQASGSTSAALAGGLEMSANPPGAAVPDPALTLTIPATALTLTIPATSLTLTVPDTALELT